MDSRLAYHLAGHVLITAMLPNARLVDQLSMTRGRKNCHKLSWKACSCDEEFDALTVMMGGKAAERLKFNANSDRAVREYERAAEVAAKLSLDVQAESETALTRIKKELGLSKHQKREAEARRVVKNAYERAMLMLRENHLALDRLAQTLRKKKTIPGIEIVVVLHMADLLRE
jgi:ATP-dependent Zn protease